jgi:hypothetical protein
MAHGVHHGWQLLVCSVYLSCVSALVSLRVACAVCWLYNGCCRYRRLTLWLPHGLAKDASLADVKAAISICCLANPSGSLDSSCSNQPYDLTRPAPAVLSMRVPAVNPGQRCIVGVKADPKVRRASSGKLGAHLRTG